MTFAVFGGPNCMTPQRRSWGEAYGRDLDLVFPTPPQDLDRVGKRFDRVVRRLSRGGVPIRYIRFHDLRHTHATLLLEDGFVRTTQELRPRHFEAACSRCREDRGIAPRGGTW